MTAVTADGKATSRGVVHGLNGIHARRCSAWQGIVHTGRATAHRAAGHRRSDRGAALHHREGHRARIHRSHAAGDRCRQGYALYACAIGGQRVGRNGRRGLQDHVERVAGGGDRSRGSTRRIQHQIGRQRVAGPCRGDAQRRVSGHAAGRCGRSAAQVETRNIVAAAVLQGQRNRYRRSKRDAALL